MTNSKALILKLTALRNLLKDCGTGAGGFQRGNSCGRTGSGNSSEGSERRRASGKRRKRKGPDTGVGPRTRSQRRKRTGRQNASRRKWLEHLKANPHDTGGRKLYRSHAEERKDHADTLRAERKELRGDIKNDRKALAKEVKGERKEARVERTKERVKLKRDQEKEATKLKATHEKQAAKLDTAYESAKAKTKNPEGLESNYREKRSELDATHKEELSDLAGEHRQARVDLNLQHREDRLREQEDHRDRVEGQKDDERASRFQQAMSHREQSHDLRSTHRDERAELKRDAREASDDKAYSFADVKASPGVDDGSGVPTAEAILTNALIATGHADAYEAGTLDDAQRREVLEAVVTEGKQWFRTEAEAMLGDLTGGGKSLFGAAKARVGAFFAKAKQHVRELFIAGVLAVTGPGPANPQDATIQANPQDANVPTTPQDAIIQETQQQVAKQIEYLDKFKQEIVTEAKPINQAVAARAEQYGSATWAGSLEVHRAWMVATGKATEVRRMLDVNENHCAECPPLAELGWVKVKDAARLKVVPLGRQRCRVNCRCWLEYR